MSGGDGEAPATPKISPERQQMLKTRKKQRSARFYWKPKGIIKVKPLRAAPNQKIMVTWHIPLENVSAGSLHDKFKSYAQYCANISSRDTLFLFRSRKRIDQIEGEIMTRSIKNYNHVIRDQHTNTLYATGRINLKTPKGVGEFDFRYFTKGMADVAEDGREESSQVVLPIARSNIFAVEVQGGNLMEALIFIKDRIATESNVSNAVLQFCNLLSQVRTLEEPFLEQKFRSPHEQERTLLNIILDLIHFSIQRVKKNQAEMEVSLFKLESDVKGQALIQEFNKLEENRRNVVSKGEELPATDFEIWKTKKGEKLLYERKISNTYAQKEVLTSALRTVIDESLCSKCLKGKDSEGHSYWKIPRKVIQRLINLVLLYDPITNKFHEDILELKRYYLDELDVFYEAPSSLDEVLQFKGFFRLISRNKLKLGFPCALGIRSPKLNLKNAAYFALDRKVSLDIKNLTTPLIPAKQFFTSRVNKLIALERLLNAGLSTFEDWKNNFKVMLVPFGSSVNNYGSYKSDLDVVLLLVPFHLEAQIFNMYNPSTEVERIKVREILWKFVLVNDVQTKCKLSRSEIISDVMKVLLKLNVAQVDDSRKDARIPILKFSIPEHEDIRHADHQSEYIDSVEGSWLECDLCIDNRLALRNTLLLQTYSLIDERVKYLAQTIKLWAKQRDINSSVRRTLPSYGYILLIFYYLQNISPPILPVLQQISLDSILVLGQKLNRTDVDFVSEYEIEHILYTSDEAEINQVLVTGADGKQYNTYFLGDPCYRYLAEEMNRGNKNKSYDVISILRDLASKNKSSLYELLTGFYEFYAFQIDSRRVVVSIRSPVVVSKENKATEESWRINDKLSIEDPFEVSYDVAHVLKKNTFSTIRSEFLRGYAILTNKLASTVLSSDSLLKTNLVDKLVEKKGEPVGEPDVIKSPLSPKVSPLLSIPIRPPGF